MKNKFISIFQNKFYIKLEEKHTLFSSFKIVLMKMEKVAKPNPGLEHGVIN